MFKKLLVYIAFTLCTANIAFAAFPDNYLHKTLDELKVIFPDLKISVHDGTPSASSLSEHYFFLLDNNKVIDQEFTYYGDDYETSKYYDDAVDYYSNTEHHGVLSSTEKDMALIFYSDYGVKVLRKSININNEDHPFIIIQFVLPDK